MISWCYKHFHGQFVLCYLICTEVFFKINCFLKFHCSLFKYAQAQGDLFMEENNLGTCKACSMLVFIRITCLFWLLDQFFLL